MKVTDNYGISKVIRLPGKETSKHMNDNNDNNVECQKVFDARKLLGKRWSKLILNSLNSKESIRFNELKKTQICNQEDGKELIIRQYQILNGFNQMNLDI